MTFLEHRIGDTRMWRMVKRFLKAGVLEEGKMYVSEEGVPQGGSISPLLSNIYLHYILDLWFEKGFRRVCGGAARLIRYAMILWHVSPHRRTRNDLTVNSVHD